MSCLEQLFQQFLRERTYINNITVSTREWYECAWKAFTSPAKVALERNRNDAIRTNWRVRIIACHSNVIRRTNSSAVRSSKPSADAIRREVAWINELSDGMSLRATTGSESRAQRPTCP